MWAPMIEKAWAKAHGAYMNTAGTRPTNALRMLTNAPVKAFELDDLEAEDMPYVFKTISEAVEAKHPTLLGVDGITNETVNSCGLPAVQAYAVLGVATVQDANGEYVDLVAVRSPWGKATNTGQAWGPDDAQWTAELLEANKENTIFAEFGDPKNVDSGIMYFAKENLKKCFTDMSIA